MTRAVITEITDVYSMGELFEEGEWGSCSVYTGALACARKINYRNAQERGPARASSPKDRAFIGTLFHKICEYYHGGRADDVAFRLKDEADQSCASEAVRLFAAYKARVPSPDFYGEVLATELTLPRTMDERSRIETLLGVSPFKCTIDLVVRATEESAQRCKSLGLELRPEGLYLLDYKTHGQRSSVMEEYFESSLQRMVYTFVAREVLEDWGELHGMVGAHVVSTKEPQLVWQMAPVASRHEEKILKYTLKYARELLDKNLPNPTQCVSRWGICPFYGECTRC